MSAPLFSQPTAVPLRPLAETAALFRQECHALDHLVEELYRDVEQLRDDLVRKGDEIEEGRRKLAERGRQLAEQRKETGRLVHLLEQQETRLTEALFEIKSLREQSTGQREEANQREAARQAFLEQTVRSAEAERDQLKHELHVLQATAGGGGGGAGSGESLAPLMSELGDLRRQLGDTQTQLDDARRQLSAAIQQSAASIQQHSAASAGGEPEFAATLLGEVAEMRLQLADTQKQLGVTQVQLGEARTQLAAGIDRAAAAVEQAALPLAASGESRPADAQTLEQLQSLERERIELESELELVRTRATELHEVVTQQRRELVEQRADITTELRLLRELVEQRKQFHQEYEPEEEPALVGAPSREPLTSAPDPVVSSVMAQFARLQKDVAQRRKKK